MSVDQLIESLKTFSEKGYGDKEVVICDDGMKPAYFKTEFAAYTNISIEKTPAVIGKRKEIVKEEVITFGNYHWEDENGKECNPGCGRIVSNGPVYRDVEKEVSYVEKPAEYETKDVVMIVTDLLNGELK